MEEKILNSFKKKLKDVKNLDLIVSLPDTFEELHECEILENLENGRVWNIICTKNGNVKDYYEL